MTISSIHPSQGGRPHRISRSRMQQLLASGGLQLVGRCRKYSSCSHSLDLACHAMPWFALALALARHCSLLLILLVVTIQASWPRQGLLAANITQLGDTGHCSLAKKTELLSELKVGAHVLHSAPTVLVIIIPIGDAQAHLDYELCRSAQSGPCGRSLSVAQQLVLETPTRTILPQVFPSTAHVLSDLPDCILHLSPTNHEPV